MRLVVFLLLALIMTGGKHVGDTLVKVHYGQALSSEQILFLQVLLRRNISHL